MTFIKIKDTGGLNFLVNVDKINYIAEYPQGEGYRATLHLVDDDGFHTMHTLEELESAIALADSQTATVIYPECKAAKS